MQSTASSSSSSTSPTAASSSSSSSSALTVTTFPPAASDKDLFNDEDDDDGWQDMPIIREDTSLSGFDEEDQKRYHYQHKMPESLAPSTGMSNATGTLIDVDDMGATWRSKLDRGDESSYTRLRAVEEDDIESDEVHMRTKYLFDEDKAMTPLSQMQATKELLTEAQRIAYVGLCALTSREMVQSLRGTAGATASGKKKEVKEIKAATANMELWALKIMGRLYYHMELETQEQKMIESLAEHGVLASDLVPALMTTHTVANPEYDPEEAAREEEDRRNNHPDSIDSDEDEGVDAEDTKSISERTLVDEPTTPTPAPASESTTPPTSPSLPSPLLPSTHPEPTPIHIGTTTTKVLPSASLPPSTLPGTHTPLTTQSLSRTSPTLTLDIRWTILCDLFLILIADSVYDARSRVLLEHVAFKLGLGYLDVVRFERRVSEALEIQEDVETLRNEASVETTRKRLRGRRYMMLGLATLGGGLVIGLSAGLLAPVIGLGLAGALTTVGVTGTSAFLGGTAGAAVITTGGVLTGSGIAVRGMAKRTQEVRTFDILPLHNNKRVNCILTVPGFMNGKNDDVRLPFSVLDPIVGDVFSVLWEPEMIRETGSALQILTGEVLSQIGMTVLQATVMTGLMTALQWPIILTKLGYLIDNPWSNALDRAKAAGKVLADVLIKRHLGVRPITLVGFSLGARVIFYALLEVAAQKAFGVVQDVFLLGATLTVSQAQWYTTRSVVSGRYVNAYAKNDWVLNYLFRATSGGVGTVAGLRPVVGVEGLENVDVTDKIAGHMSYRTFMPLILDQLGFPVFADFFDEPEEPDFDEERIVVREDPNAKKSSGWFGRKNRQPSTPPKYVQRPPSAATYGQYKKKGSLEEEVDADAKTLNGSVLEKSGKGSAEVEGDDELPPRMDNAHANGNGASDSLTTTPTPSRPGTPSQHHLHSHSKETSDSSVGAGGGSSKVPLHAGFDLGAIKNVLQEVETSAPPPSGHPTSNSSHSITFDEPHTAPYPPPADIDILTNARDAALSLSSRTTHIQSSLANGTASVSLPPTPANGKRKSFFSRLSSSPNRTGSGSGSGKGSRDVSPSGSPKPSALNLGLGLGVGAAVGVGGYAARSQSTPPTWQVGAQGQGQGLGQGSTQDEATRRSLDSGQYIDVPEMGLDERGLKTTGGIGMGMGMGFATSNAHSAFLSSLPDDIVPSWGASSASVNSVGFGTAAAASSAVASSLQTPTTAKPFSTPSFNSSSTFSSSSSSFAAASNTFTNASSSFNAGASTSGVSNPFAASTTFNNPFKAPNHDRTPVLSFGGGDDAVGDQGRSHATTANSGWDLPPIKRRGTGGLDGMANPWS